jgi:uncharacterized membrane protein
MSKKRKHRLPLSQQLSQHSRPLDQQEVRAIIRQEFSGPLPPPAILEKYNEIIENGAERIMVMAEEQSKHRKELEKKALDTDSRNSLLGVIFAFILGVTTITIGGLVILKGQPWPGTIIGSGGLVALVYAFIYGTRARTKEREAKAKTS